MALLHSFVRCEKVAMHSSKVLFPPTISFSMWYSTSRVSKQTKWKSNNHSAHLKDKELIWMSGFVPIKLSSEHFGFRLQFIPLHHFSTDLFSLFHKSFPFHLEWSEKSDPNMMTKKTCPVFPLSFHSLYTFFNVMTNCGLVFIRLFTTFLSREWRHNVDSSGSNLFPQRCLLVNK